MQLMSNIEELIQTQVKNNMIPVILIPYQDLNLQA